MAASLTTQHGVLGGKFVSDSSANAVIDANVTGGASNIFYVEIDNTANSAASYLKLYDNANVTVGTTAPNMVLRCAASKKQYFVTPQGVAFASALSYACTTTGGTGGTSSPQNAVIVKMIVS